MNKLHPLELQGAKKVIYGLQTHEKLLTLNFSWTIPRYNIGIYGKNSKYENCNQALQWILCLQDRVKDFAEYACVTEDKIQVDLDYTNSYYDSVEINFYLSVSRLENDEEYTARKILIDEAAAKAAEVAKEHAQKKIKNEKLQLKKLIKKYGVPE